MRVAYKSPRSTPSGTFHLRAHIKASTAPDPISSHNLCREIALAFEQQNLDLVASLVAQLSESLSSNSPDSFPAIVEFRLVLILLDLLHMASLPACYRRTVLSCLVNITSMSPGLPLLFQTPQFMRPIAAFFRIPGIGCQDVFFLFQILRNVIFALDPDVHAFVLANLPVTFLQSLATTANGGVLKALLDCVNCLSRLPVDRTNSNAILNLVVEARFSRCSLDVLKSCTWTLIYLVQRNCLDFEEFQKLGFLPKLAELLVDPVEAAAALGWKLIGFLSMKFPVTFGFKIERLIEILDSPKEEANAQSCAFALSALFRHQDNLTDESLQMGIFPKLLRIFGRRAIQSKVALLSVFHELVRRANDAIMEESRDALFGLCCELLETKDEEVVQRCFRLFLLVFKRADNARAIEQCRQAFWMLFEMDMIDDIEFAEEETTALIASVVQFEAMPERIVQRSSTVD
jgi:hypothetical protein